MCCLVHYGHCDRGEDVRPYMPQVQGYGLQVWPVLASPSAFWEQYDSADVVLDSIEAARIGPLDERERIERCCVAQEVAFARRVPGTDHLIAGTALKLEQRYWERD